MASFIHVFVWAFPPICLLMPFNPFFLPPSGNIHLVLFARVSILTRSHLCSLVKSHFITCLTDVSVQLLFFFRPFLWETLGVERSAQGFSDPPTPKACLLRSRLIFYLSALSCDSPTGSSPMLRRTPRPCWANWKKEPSTWPGPSLLMATVLSYATSWRSLKTVSLLQSSTLLSTLWDLCCDIRTYKVQTVENN